MRRRGFCGGDFAAGGGEGNVVTEAKVKIAVGLIVGMNLHMLFKSLGRKRVGCMEFCL